MGASTSRWETLFHDLLNLLQSLRPKAEAQPLQYVVDFTTGWRNYNRTTIEVCRGSFQRAGDLHSVFLGPPGNASCADSNVSFSAFF